MSKQTDYIAKIAPIIQKYAPQYGIKCCSAIIAQACLESAYGSSKLSAKYHNHFGLKCGSKWTGKRVDMKTGEEYSVGTHTTITAAFRVYDSMDLGVKGYFEFIQLARYANLKGITDPQKYLETIKADGYATSSKYVENNMNVIKSYNLTKYDVKGGGNQMNAIDKLLKIAEGEVGYLEKKSNKDLNSKTANAGSGNWTKYARDLQSWTGRKDIYPNAAAWCDMFVDWCMVKAFGVSKAMKLLGGWSAYTPTSAQYYKVIKRWHTTPKAGDQIFFKNTRRICHTGLVYKVENGKVYTIEGNTSGASGVVANGGGVCKKSYSLTNSRIAGYGRPDYSLAGGEKEMPAREKTEAKKAYSGAFPSLPSRGYYKFNDGITTLKTYQSHIKRVQALVNWIADTKLDVDGKYGAHTEQAVKKAQKLLGVKADGKLGEKTLAAAKVYRK